MGEVDGRALVGAPLHPCRRPAAALAHHLTSLAAHVPHERPQVERPARESRGPEPVDVLGEPVRPPVFWLRRSTRLDEHVRHAPDVDVRERGVGVRGRRDGPRGRAAGPGGGPREGGEPVLRGVPDPAPAGGGGGAVAVQDHGTFLREAGAVGVASGL